MGLERDEGGRGMLGRGRVLKVPDHVEVAEVHAVEAADRERDRPDRLLREPDVDLQISTLDPLLWVAGLCSRFSGKLRRFQLSTFSGTNVRRKGSAWPSATSR